jgi:hypothetical protein
MKDIDFKLTKEHAQGMKESDITLGLFLLEELMKSYRAKFEMEQYHIALKERRILLQEQKKRNIAKVIAIIMT